MKDYDYLYEVRRDEKLDQEERYREGIDFDPPRYYTKEEMADRLARAGIKRKEANQ